MIEVSAWASVIDCREGFANSVSSILTFYVAVRCELFLNVCKRITPDIS